MLKHTNISEFDVDVMPYNRKVKYSGEYYGIVIDPYDKHGTGGVKVHIPSLMRKMSYNQGIWVQRLYQTEGEKSAIWYNQWVLVKFKNGDPCQGFIFGVMKHYDEAPPPDTNTKSLRWPTKKEDVTPPKLLEAAYSSLYQNTKMSKKETRNAARTHVMFKTPRFGHTMRVIEDEDHSFYEVRTQKGNTFTLSDTMNYAYINSMNPKNPGDFMDSQALFLSGLHKYSELMACAKWGIHADGKKMYTVVRSKTNMFMMDDKTKATFDVCGQDQGAMVGTAPEIMWKDPTDRFAPISKAKARTIPNVDRQNQQFSAKQVNGNTNMGVAGLQMKYNDAATYLSKKSGYIMLNCV